MPTKTLSSSVRYYEEPSEKIHDMSMPFRHDHIITDIFFMILY